MEVDGEDGTHRMSQYRVLKKVLSSPIDDTFLVAVTLIVISGMLWRLVH